MKILSAENQRDADRTTILNEPITSLALMERASERWLETARPFLRYRKIMVLAGFGNNGGDGLAIARLLLLSKFQVEVILVKLGNSLSADCAQNLERLPPEIPIHIIENSAEIEFAFGDLHNTVVIDALFGSGLNRPLSGGFATIVKKINAEKPYCLAVDIPSGLFSDKMNAADDAVLPCKHTITFQSPKLSLLFPENQALVGGFSVANIELDKTFIAALTCENNFLEKSEIVHLLKPREPFSHKGNFGHAAIVHGNLETQGAAIMASEAAFCAGAGLTSILLANHEKVIGYPHLMQKSLFSDNFNNYYLCIGPGLGTDGKAIEKLKYCIDLVKKPVVFDADALNLISQNQKLLLRIPAQSIFTPHPKELERLIGKTNNSFEQLQVAKQFAKQHGIILLIKRSYTVIIDHNGQAFFNSTGNAGLAKAGSGDVLAGIITAFLAQGYIPFEAAKIGVYAHGFAADLLQMDTSQFAFTPQKLIEYIGKASQKLIG